jgi:hypothetical protein
MFFFDRRAVGYTSGWGVMTHKAIQRILLVFVALVVTTVCALAQDHKALIGKWNMTSETDGDPVNWTLVFKEDNGKLAAVLAAGEGEQPVKDLTYTNGVLKFKVPYQGEYYDIELKQGGEKLDGKWSGMNGDSGKTSGTKS